MWSSSLKIKQLDGESVDRKEQAGEGNEHCNCGTRHPMFKSKALLEELLDRAIETRSDDPRVDIAQLRCNDASEGPCHWAYVIEPDPPAWDSLVEKKKIVTREIVIY